MEKIYKGIVQTGPQRGTALGFPTINIALNDTSVSGVYAACVVIEEKEYFAAAFADQDRNLLEAYLLDFSGDLYAKNVEIFLEKKIREAQKFDNDDALRAAIANDVLEIRKFLAGI